MKNKVIKVNYGYDKSNIKLLSVLAYIGPLFVMGLFAVEKDSPEVKFHSRQGGILFALVALLYFVSYVISYFIYFFPAFSEIVGLLILVLISVGWFILVIMGVSGALRGEMNPLPLVGDIDKIIKGKKQ